MHNMDWDDLRYFAAVAETGSLNAAARRLGVNHATVLRRIAAFEARAGVRLFLRSRSGYRLAPNAQEVVDAMREMARGAERVARVLAGLAGNAGGRVRLTSTDTFCIHVLPPILRDFAAANPDIEVTLLCSNAHVDLARPDAEVTLRPTVRPSPELVARPAGGLRFLACRADGAAQDRWIGLAPPLSASRPGQWLAAHVPREAQALKVDSFLAAARLCAQGAGCALLPAPLLAHQPGLARIDGIAPIEVPLWVACHRDLADGAAVRALMDALVAALAERAELLCPPA